MSYPNILFGDFGDEKQTWTTKPESIALGQEMKLPDGGEFHLAKASATAVVAGDLYQQNAMSALAGSAMLWLTGRALAATAAVGASTIQVTMAGTAVVTKDFFADGDLYVDTGASVLGYHYKIKSNNSAAAGSTCTLTLHPKDRVVEALPGGTATVGLRPNPFSSITLTTSDTVLLGKIVGIAPTDIAASAYGWIRSKGICAALTDGTLVAGQPICVASTAGGAVGVAVASTTATIKDQTVIGRCLNVSASTKASLVELNIV